MSRSIHTTYKDLKGLTKREIDEQSIDPYSDLAKLGEKGYVKRTVIKNRKQKKAEQSIANEGGETVKILFRFHCDVLDEETVETMWATIVDKDKGLYKLDSIPFYAPLVASDDIVFAEFDDQEQMLNPLVQVFPITPKDTTLVQCLPTCTHYPRVFKTHKHAHWYEKSTNSMRVFRKNQYFNAKTIYRVTASWISMV
jgi:hypothetical protein